MGNKHSVFTNITDQPTLIRVVKEEKGKLEEELKDQISEAKKDLLTALSDPNSVSEIKRKLKLREDKVILRSFIEGIKKAEDRLEERQYPDIYTLAVMFEKLFKMSHGCTEVQLKASLVDLDTYLDNNKKENN